MPAQTNKFIDINRQTKSTRRQSASAAGIVGDNPTPQQLATELRRLASRVQELEAAKAPFWIEFEVSCPAAGTVTIEHGFGCPVRFYVVNWRAAAANPPVLRENSASTTKTLVLNSQNAGRAVIRVEQSPYSLQAGNA